MSEPCTKKELVVIADDDPTIRTLMKTSLVKDGFGLGFNSRFTFGHG